jgi:hypothetical protein
MTIQLTRRERILHRVVIGSFVALGLSHLTATWLLRGQPELLLRWLVFSKYMTAAGLGLQLAELVFVIRRSGIVPTILMFIGGVAFIGFIIFPRMWLLPLGIGMSIASGVWVVWPQIRDLFLWMASSYREIAKASKM